jgi:hypothetical protein
MYVVFLLLGLPLIGHLELALIFHQSSSHHLLFLISLKKDYICLK